MYYTFHVVTLYTRYYNSHVPFSYLILRRLPTSTLFPYTTLFRSVDDAYWRDLGTPESYVRGCADVVRGAVDAPERPGRSEEHTSELQSRGHLVCRLLLEKKKKISDIN